MCLLWGCGLICVGAASYAPHLSAARCVCAWSNAWRDSPPGRSICHTTRSDRAVRRYGCADGGSGPTCRQRRGRRRGKRTDVRPCACARAAWGSPWSARTCRKRGRQSAMLPAWNGCRVEPIPVVCDLMQYLPLVPLTLGRIDTQEIEYGGLLRIEAKELFVRYALCIDQRCQRTERTDAAPGNACHAHT